MGVFLSGCVYERKGGKQKERQRKREREMSVEWKQKPAQYKVK